MAGNLSRLYQARKRTARDKAKEEEKDIESVRWTFIPYNRKDDGKRVMK